MKTKNLLSLFGIIVFSFSIRAQCTGPTSFSTTPTTITSQTTSYSNSMGVDVIVCCDGVLYDTINNNNNMRYVIHQNGKLYKKNGVTTLVWMTGGTLINKGGTSQIMAYTESTATITNSGTPSVITTTCSTLSNMPLNNCFPLTGGPCSANKINEHETSFNNTISFYPNPANNNLIINVVGKVNGTYSIINCLGQSIRSFVLESGSSKIDVSDMSEGVYFLNFNGQGKVNTQKLIIKR